MWNRIYLATMTKLFVFLHIKKSIRRPSCLAHYPIVDTKQSVTPFVCHALFWPPLKASLLCPFKQHIFKLSVGHHE